MAPTLTHTHTPKNKLLHLQLHPPLIVLCLKQIVGPLDSKMAQLFMNMPHKDFTLF
jgi:hypothetical protein